ncbi:MAG: hypothetical protein LBP62_02340 [Clostridiales bacterium]|nr:hypothetical protein [Clostridiales bacterium]
MEARLLLKAYNGETEVNQDDTLEIILERKIKDIKQDKMKILLKDENPYSEIHDIINEVIKEYINDNDI